MIEKLSHFVWLQNSSSRFDLLALDYDKEIKIIAEYFDWKNYEKALDYLNRVEDSILIVDIEKKDHINLIEEVILSKLIKEQILFILTPESMRTEVKKMITSRKNVYRILKPVRKSELLILLQKTLLANFLVKKLQKKEENELIWLRRIEKVFDLSRDELLEKEKTNIAYEHLIEYEEALLQEQKRINEALMELHEFKDKNKADWEKEKKARETVEIMYSKELKDKNKTLHAQEQLLSYSYKEKEALKKVLDEFHKEGVLPKETIERIIRNQQDLISKIEEVLN